MSLTYTGFGSPYTGTPLATRADVVITIFDFPAGMWTWIDNMIAEGWTVSAINKLVANFEVNLLNARNGTNNPDPYPWTATIWTIDGLGEYLWSGDQIPSNTATLYGPTWKQFYFTSFYFIPTFF